LHKPRRKKAKRPEANPEASQALPGQLQLRGEYREPNSASQCQPVLTATVGTMQTWGLASMVLLGAIYAAGVYIGGGLILLILVIILIVLLLRR
jgi:hypothetical protein